MVFHSRTERLDLTDALKLHFEATVVEQSNWNEAPSVLLDRTAFYPESGGQLADAGTLGGVSVVNVQLDDRGRLHHVLDGACALPASGSRVHGEVDVQRRRQHMAQHTGQHLLSWALTEHANAPTLSSRLGESACTIDVRRRSLGEGELCAATDIVNTAIVDDHEVRLLFPTASELEQMPLRRQSKVTEGVRVVAIGDFELVPCGGTHCQRTSQVGLLTILGAERYKGMTRMTFAAGQRARKKLENDSRVLKDLAHRFTCSAQDVPKAIGRLEQALAGSKDGLKSLRDELADEKARALLTQKEDPFVVAAFPNAHIELLRAIGRRIVKEPGRVALLAAPSAEGTAIFAARSDQATPQEGTESLPFDCGAFLRAVTKEAGGRGGGRATHAEGRLPLEVDWTVMVERLRT